MVAVLLVVVGTDHDQQHCCHHVPKVKSEAATAVVELLMMGMRMPETCWAVFKWQVRNLRNCCIWLVDSFECNLQTLNSRTPFDIRRKDLTNSMYRLINQTNADTHQRTNVFWVYVCFKSVLSFFPSLVYFYFSFSFLVISFSFYFSVLTYLHKTCLYIT